MKRKTLSKTLVAIASIIFFSTTINVVVGSHEHNYKKTIIEADCENRGVIKHECICRDRIEQTIPAKGHDFTAWKLLVKPTAASKGEENRTCLRCKKVESRAYICSHKNTTEKVIEKATCQNEGYSQVVCDFCNKILEEITVPTIECNYSKWKTEKTATPISNGLKYRTCSTCKNKETKVTYFNKKAGNSIYIEAAGIYANYTFGGFSQAEVDKYDIVFNTSRMGANNPMIMGHNSRSLGKLYKAYVGSYIYLINSDGSVETFKVFVSEEGKDLYWDIEGIKTGARLITIYDTKTLHIYTCYGLGNRWMVLAKKV